MFRFLLVALMIAFASAFMAPALPSKVQQSKVMMGEGGKGFGGGEATRDPEPTEVDPNDPKVSRDVCCQTAATSSQEMYLGDKDPLRGLLLTTPLFSLLFHVCRASSRPSTRPSPSLSTSPSARPPTRFAETL